MCVGIEKIVVAVAIVGMMVYAHVTRDGDG